MYVSIYIYTYIYTYKHTWYNKEWMPHIDGLMQERRNSIANALELRLSCTNRSIRCTAVMGDMGQSVSVGYYKGYHYMFVSILHCMRSRGRGTRASTHLLKSRVVMTPIYRQWWQCMGVVVMTTCSVTIDNKVGNMRTRHCTDVIMGAMASQITSLKIVCSSIYWGAAQRKHQSSASLAFVRGIHRGPVSSPHKWPVTRKMFPLNDVIMY